jgi:hypothetical protein
MLSRVSQNCKIDPDNHGHEMPKEHHLVHVRFAPIYEQTYRYIPSSKDKKRTLGQWLGIIQNTGVECLDTITHQKEHTQMVSRLAWEREALLLLDSKECLEPGCSAPSKQTPFTTQFTDHCRRSQARDFRIRSIGSPAVGLWSPLQRVAIDRTSESPKTCWIIRVSKSLNTIVIYIDSEPSLVLCSKEAPGTSSGGCRFLSINIYCDSAKKGNANTTGPLI